MAKHGGRSTVAVELELLHHAARILSELLHHEQLLQFVAVCQEFRGFVEDLLADGRLLDKLFHYSSFLSRTLSVQPVEYPPQLQRELKISLISRGDIDGSFSCML